MFPIQRFFAPAVLAAALAGPALAQTAPADSARTYRHQLGLTASPQLDHFFTANRSLPVGLIYKQQLKPGRALRLRLVGFYSRRDSTNDNPYFTPVVSSVGPNVRTWEANAFIGYEWQHQLSRRFKWGYGVDVGGGYHNQSTTYSLQELQTTPGTNHTYIVTTDGNQFLHRWSVQGRGFTTLNYIIGSRLTLFAETALLLTYENQQRGGKIANTFSDGQPPRSVGGGYNNINNKYFNLYFRPVQLLGLTTFF